MIGWRLTRPPRKPLDQRPEDFGLERYETVEFPSRDGHTMLRGWYISAAENGFPSRHYVLIMAHGYSQNRLEPHLPALSLAARLIADGYDVLMFDFRNAGLSDGKQTTVGFREQEDLLGAIAYMASRTSAEIGLIGFSMGAATSLLAAARDSRVKAVVADSPFYALREYLAENMPHWTGLPHFPFTPLILTLIPMMLRADLQAVTPYRAMEQLTGTPVLLIHGTGDETIPCTNSEQLLRHARHPLSRLWLVPDAGHVRSYAAAPDDYVQTVTGFLEQTAENPLSLQKG